MYAGAMAPLHGHGARTRACMVPVATCTHAPHASSRARRACMLALVPVRTSGLKNSRRICMHVHARVVPTRTRTRACARVRVRWELARAWRRVRVPARRRRRAHVHAACARATTSAIAIADDDATSRRIGHGDPYALPRCRPLARIAIARYSGRGARA